MAQTRIAVLGAGNIGGNLGRKWLAAGHQVEFGVADPNGAKVQTLKADLGDKAVIRAVAEVIPNAEVVAFALPSKALADTVATNAAALDGKLVIDITNNIDGSGPINGHAVFQQHMPTARYARTFNFLGAENYADPTFAGGPADMFYIGPQGDQAIIEDLITAAGYRPLYVGSSDQAALLDSLLQIWFALSREHGRRLAFKVVTP